MGRIKHFLRDRLSSSKTQIMLLFGLEGILYQFIGSSTGFGNGLYATNLGATDTQIGLIQTIPNLIAVLLFLPVGLLSERTRYSRTVPGILLVIAGIMFLGFGTVPVMGEYKMIFYFIFLGFTIGIMVIYNAQWQNLFGDVTPPSERNASLTFRNRLTVFIGMLTPLLCGTLMSAADDTAHKLMVLRIFYYISGAFMLIQACIIFRMPCKPRNPDAVKASLRDIPKSIRACVHSKDFRIFFIIILFFYLVWHIDFSTWYLLQIRYIGMTEAHMSYCTALICIAQLITIGFFSKLNQKKSVHFTMIFGCLGLLISPVAALVALPLPEAMRPWTFIIVNIIGGVLQICLSLCLVQILLEVIPTHNRALTISLYTIIITLSNSLMPLLGVKLYALLGGDLRAMMIFYITICILRVISTSLFTLRYHILKRQNKLFPENI